jgi:DNA-binding CsgD family transcriptional regulator
MIFDEEKIESLIAQCRLVHAGTVLAAARADPRLRAGVYALAADDRGLASVIDPKLLFCRNGADVASYYADVGLEPTPYDHLIAAAVLAWSADADATVAALNAAYARALSLQRFDLAVAARERLAHHALLFGELERSRSAIHGALELAQRHDLASWALRALAAAARIALDSGDLDAAAQLLARGEAAAGSAEELILFAATGAQLAVELGDHLALARWSSPDTLDTALRCESPEAAISGTIAGVVGAGAPARNPAADAALRRALQQIDNAANAAELFTIAARYGELEDSRRAAKALAAVVAPQRPYLRAHRLLARAHVFLRSGERLASIDCAGDAARAFSAMGLRRWTDEAMRLLVTREQGAQRHARGRPSGSALTQREEQIAQLIRRGASNREVATALQISEHTVERHVSSILGRLGLRSRWQIGEARKAGDKL